MENDQNKIASESNQVDPHALTKEISRAMEMMKRIKKSSAAKLAESPEPQRMTSYLIPDQIVLCQSCNLI